MVSTKGLNGKATITSRMTEMSMRQLPRFVHKLDRVNVLRRDMRGRLRLRIDHDEQGPCHQDVKRLLHREPPPVLRAKDERSERRLSASREDLRRIHCCTHSILQLERNILRFQVRLQPLMRQFAAEAGFLH